MLLVTDTPLPIKPPGEGRETGTFVHERDQQPATFEGQTGIGQPEPPRSSLEARPARVPFNTYSHEQDAGQVWTNDGGHVAVGWAPGIPDGDQEAGAGIPQRPTFRTPPSSWTAPLTDDES